MKCVKVIQMWSNSVLACTERACVFGRKLEAEDSFLQFTHKAHSFCSLSVVCPCEASVSSAIPLSGKSGDKLLKVQLVRRSNSISWVIFLPWVPRSDGMSGCGFYLQHLLDSEDFLDLGWFAWRGNTSDRAHSVQFEHVWDIIWRFKTKKNEEDQQNQALFCSQNFCCSSKNARQGVRSCTIDAGLKHSSNGSGRIMRAVPRTADRLNGPKRTWVAWYGHGVVVIENQ